MSLPTGHQEHSGKTYLFLSQHLKKQEGIGGDVPSWTEVVHASEIPLYGQTLQEVLFLCWHMWGQLD